VCGVTFVKFQQSNVTILLIPTHIKLLSLLNLYSKMSASFMIIRLMIQEKVLMLLLVTIVFQKSFTLY